MIDPDSITRRQVLAGLGGVGIGAAVLGSATYWPRTDEPAVRTDDDETTVHDAQRGDGPPEPPEPEDKSHEISLEMPKKDGERFNSNSVSFDHDAFQVCNRGTREADVWIDADAIENDRGEPAIRFYRDGDLSAYVDDPKRAVTLEPDTCLRIGLLTRTFGVAAETRLLETVSVRTDRTP